MLKVVELSKLYKDKVAVDKVSLTFPDKGLVVVKGESGCGKTTLLNMLTALDFPTDGSVEFDGIEITLENGEDYRRKYCGNIYQDYMLIGGLTVRENIELGLQASGEPYTIDEIVNLLDKVSLPKEYIDKKVSKLSGGEKQRVSIARAISKKYAMIFADEPTGNLDRKNGVKVMDILKEISKERLVVVVSHNEKFNSIYADYTVELFDGKVKSSDLPSQDSVNEINAEKNSKREFDSKSKLRPKTVARLAYWGFEKNKVKTVVSIISFIMICILSVVFTVATLGDSNLAYASSLAKCENKNLFAISTGGGFSSAFVAGANGVDLENIDSFKEELRYGCSELYSVPINGSMFNLDDESNEKYKEKYIEVPTISNGIIYNDAIGIDGKILCGDYPKEYNDVMLPNCFAQYILQVSEDLRNCTLNDLVGREFACATPPVVKNGRYYSLRICGVFEEGPYYTDYDSPSEDMVNYFKKTNMLACSAIFAPQIKKVWHYNSNSFGGAMKIGFIRLIEDMRIGNKKVYAYGYDGFSDYGNDNPYLEYDEVYIDKNLAETLNIKVGDLLTDVSAMIGDRYSSSRETLDDFTVKSIIDLPNMRDGIVFSSEYYDDIIVTNPMPITFKGFYFNMKDVKDVYGFLNQISSVGYKENFWMTSSNIDEVHTENLLATSNLWSMCVNMRYMAFLPLMLVSFIGLAALGYVSISYLISSKSKSYNILRSLGFGKKSILLILFIQVMTVIVAECILGISFGALCCHLFGRIFADYGVPAGITPEVPMPIGYAAPLIVVGLSLLIGGIIVLAHTRSIFSKSIIENKTK